MFQTLPTLHVPKLSQGRFTANPQGVRFAAFGSASMAVIFRQNRLTGPSLLLTLLSLILSVAASAGFVRESSRSSSLSMPEVGSTSPEVGAVLRPVRSRHVGMGAATALREGRHELLCVFSVVRRRLSEGDMLENSLRCLREAIPSGIEYDQIAFHEGHVASEELLRLSSRL